MPKLKSRKREMFAIETASMTPLPKAYILAGYRDSPWARYNASKLAHVPEVAKRIDELQAEFSARSGLHAAYLQRQLLPLVEANAADLFERQVDAEGNKVGICLRPIPDMPRELTAAISKIKCDPETGAVTEVSLYSKTEAGNTLMRSVGGLIDRHEHDVSGIGARLTEALGRLGRDDKKRLANNVIKVDAASIAESDENLPESM